MSRDSDDLVLPDRRTVLIAAIVLIALIGLGTAINSYRRANQYAAVFDEVCGLEIPTPTLLELDKLASDPMVSGGMPKGVAEQLHAVLPSGSHAEIFFWFDGQLWRMTRYTPLMVVTEAALPGWLGGWDESLGSECHGGRTWRTFRVARHILLPSGAQALIVVRSDAQG